MGYVSGDDRRGDHVDNIWEEALSGDGKVEKYIGQVPLERLAH